VITRVSTKYATGGGTSRSHNTSLGLVEDALNSAGVPCKSTGSTNGSGTKNTFVRQLPPTMNEASTKNASKIIPDLVLIAIHLSGSNGVDCALDGADHIVDCKALQGLSHCNNTSTTPGATLEKRQKAVNQEYQIVQRSPTQSCMARSETKEVQLRVNSMSTATRAVSLPQLSAATGVLLQTSASYWTLLPRELARKHTAFYNIDFSEAKAMFKQKLARK